MKDKNMLLGRNICVLGISMLFRAHGLLEKATSTSYFMNFGYIVIDDVILSSHN